MHFNKGLFKIESRTTDALVRVYLSVQQIVGDLYAEADNAVAEGNYNDASLLTGQADILYQVAENLGTVITQEE